MDRGTYAAASAGLVQLRKLDVVNNNLANVNTPGYKRQYLVHDERQFEDTLAKSLEGEDPFARGDHDRVHGAIHSKSVTDFTQGSIRNTGSDLDVALRHPSDFFVINTPSGTEYTRAGNFTLNEEGQLVTHDGMVVQGDGGAITAEGAGMKITPGGGLISNGQEVGKLQVVRFEGAPPLERTAGTRFKLLPGNPQPEARENPDVEPQALEMSNVTALTSVIELIGASRGFEMYTKSAKAIDEMNQTAVTKIGRKSA
jgi:flagellar basal body rod protein FlgG